MKAVNLFIIIFPIVSPFIEMAVFIFLLTSSGCESGRPTKDIKQYRENRLQSSLYVEEGIEDSVSGRNETK